MHQIEKLLWEEGNPPSRQARLMGGPEALLGLEEGDQLGAVFVE